MYSTKVAGGLRSRLSFEGSENTVGRARRILESPRFCVAVLAFLLAWEFCTLLLHARGRLLWYDEILTFHVSALQPFSQLWAALRNGVDGMPPGYYLLVRLARLLPASPEIALRVPSIIGYLLTLLGVYWFTRKRLPAPAGLAAVILIVLSPFREYALEGRSYALLVGFLAISATLWQRIGEHRLIPTALALLLTLAVSSHHLAVVALLPFAAAEFSWTIQARRIRWGLWAGFVVATTPFVAGLPILFGYRATYGKTFWSRPTWVDTLGTYGGYLGLHWYLVLVLVAFFLFTAGGALTRTRRFPDTDADDPGLPAPEIILVGGFLLYPALLVVLTKLAGSGYTFRYGWPGLPGLVWAFVFLIGPIWSTRRAAHLLAALVIAVAVLGGFEATLLSQAPDTGAHRISRRWSRLALLTDRDPTLPVVIASGMGYLEATVYSPPALRERLVQVVSPEIAIRATGTDTVETTNRQLSHFVPLHLESPAPFLARHPRFHLYSGGGNDWMTRYLVENGYQLRLVSPEDGCTLYVAQR